MLPFRYFRPRQTAEVITLLLEHAERARILAGGTDLTVGLRHGAIRAGAVIDIKRVEDLPKGISHSGSLLRFGTDVLMTDLMSHPMVTRVFPALSEAAAVVGSPQIRNRATVVGNICNGSPAADTVPVLVLHDAFVTITGPTGDREVAVVDFITGNRRLDLNAGEFVTAVSLPVPAQPCGAAFDRITRRRGVDLATVNLCCRLDSEGELAMAIGAASPRPLLVLDTARDFAAASNPQEEQAVLDMLVAKATPISDVRASADYRRGMLRVLARRTLKKAKERLNAQRG